MTVDSEIFSISTLNTIEYGPLTLNIKPHLDPLVRSIKDDLCDILHKHTDFRVLGSSGLNLNLCSVYVGLGRVFHTLAGLN